MRDQDTLTSGTSDDRQPSGINDENEDLDNEELDNEDEELDDDDQDDDQEQDQQPKQDWRKKFYSTTNLQNRQIADLKKELSQLKNSKTISDADLEKIRDKYNEEDLEIIEKIIENKANQLMDTRQATSLSQRELNIFVKEHPELEDGEIRHIQSLQKDYGYSLKKAYTILFGKGFDDQKPQPKKHSIWDSFWWDKPNKSWPNKQSDDESKAFKDMDAFL